MYRKVTVSVQVLLRLEVDEGVEISKAINEMDYNFISGTHGAVIADTEIIGHEVQDSR
jgi:hypothetical protein